jgi:hypothetical protein
VGKRDLTNVTLSDVVTRARSVVGSGTYKLGMGGRNPELNEPFDKFDRCDCSGFVAWCLGIDRYQPGRIDGDWIETTAVYHDTQLFTPMNDRLPGYVIVYPDANGHQGHIGIISAVDFGGRITRVIHCSHSNSESGKGAVQETAPNVFLAHPWRVLRFNAAEPGKVTSHG